MKKPSIAITMGDPLGIGPEIVIKAMSQNEIFETCNPVIVGDKAILYKAAKLTNNNQVYDRMKTILLILILKML